MSSTQHHLVVVLPSKGFPVIVENRPTPTPGVNGILVEAKAVALNPIDWYMRDFGFALSHYPTVVGSDVAGVVVSAGSSVPDMFKPGTRVAAFAPCFFVQGASDNGALQTRVLVPSANAVPIPDSMSFNKASLLPMAVTTAWSGWYSIGLARETAYKAPDKQGMLVWGGASSIGSAAHHEYVKSLGASKVFEYKGAGVVEGIVMTAKEDGVTIRVGFDAAGGLKEAMEVLRELKGEGTASLAEAKPLPQDVPKVDGVEVKFVAAPTEQKEMTEFFEFVWNVWLKEKLERREFVPSPKIQVFEGGLEAVSKAMDVLKGGVSGVKIVLEV